MYAYGSGAAASFFAFKVKSSPAKLAENLQLTQKLDSMRIASCEEFVECLKVSQSRSLGFSPDLTAFPVTRLSATSCVTKKWSDDVFLLQFFSVRHSFERRPTTPSRTSPLDLWMTSGRDRTTLPRSTPSLGVGTRSRRRLKKREYVTSAEVPPLFPFFTVSFLLPSIYPTFLSLSMLLISFSRVLFFCATSISTNLPPTPSPRSSDLP